jgi:peptidoglycan/xylan/chitin deacetylase (PgdA/CDA1 family)
VADKLDYLLKNGYEIANHTSTHSSLRRMAPDKIRWELATAVRDIKQIAPKAQMQTLALPYGQVPRNKEALKCLVSGADKGTNYKNIAVLKAAWRPVLSPITQGAKLSRHAMDYCLYDPFNLERCVPDPRQAAKPGTFEYWLKYFDQNPSLRYVSDGNPKIAAVP